MFIKLIKAQEALILVHVIEKVFHFSWVTLGNPFFVLPILTALDITPVFTLRLSILSFMDIIIHVVLEIK